MAQRLLVRSRIPWRLACSRGAQPSTQEGQPAISESLSESQRDGSVRRPLAAGDLTVSPVVVQVFLPTVVDTGIVEYPRPRLSLLRALTMTVTTFLRGTATLVTARRPEPPRAVVTAVSAYNWSVTTRRHLPSVLRFSMAWRTVIRATFLIPPHEPYRLQRQGWRRIGRTGREAQGGEAGAGRRDVRLKRLANAGGEGRASTAIRREGEWRHREVRHRASGGGTLIDRKSTRLNPVTFLYLV